MIPNSNNQFTNKIIYIITSIPKGMVCSYGNIAIAANNPGSTRFVVTILKKYAPFENFPWHRVINKKGRISIKDPKKALLQKELLIEEGVHIDENYFIINFEDVVWYPKNIDT